MDVKLTWGSPASSVTLCHPGRRKKRLQEKDLVDRLQKYEMRLSENSIKFESIATEVCG